MPRKSWNWNFGDVTIHRKWSRFRTWLKRLLSGIQVFKDIESQFDFYSSPTIIPRLQRTISQPHTPATQFIFCIENSNILDKHIFLFPILSRRVNRKIVPIYKKLIYCLSQRTHSASMFKVPTLQSKECSYIAHLNFFKHFSVSCFTLRICY